MLIDLTFSIEERMTTPNVYWHPKVEIVGLGTISKENRNTHKLVLGTHTGTHMDAPRHLIEGGQTIDQIDPALFVQKALLMKFDNKGAGDFIDHDELAHYDSLLSGVSAVVIRTGWSKWWMTDKYYKQWPYLSEKAAQYLVDKGIKVIGMDMPSPDSADRLTPGSSSPIHCQLMGQGIILVEYLNNLELINKDIFKLYSFPLKLKGLDGSPARVLAEV